MKTKNSKNPNPAARRVSSRWSWHYERLLSLRDVLLEDRDDQAEEFIEPIEIHSIDDADRATNEFDRNLALGILSHEEDTLFEVDAAIQRILDETYGICEVTGNPIPEARLRVVPWTRYTKEALERIESRGEADRRRLVIVSSIRGPASGGTSQGT